VKQFYFKTTDINRKLCAGLMQSWSGYTFDSTSVTLAAHTAMIYDETNFLWREVAVAGDTLTLSEGYNYVAVRTTDGLTATFVNLGADNSSYVFSSGLTTVAPVVTFLKEGSNVQDADFSNVCQTAVPQLLIKASSGPNNIYLLSAPNAILATSGDANNYVTIASTVAVQAAEARVVQAFDSSTDNLHLYTYSSGPLPTTWTKAAASTSFLTNTYQVASGGTAGITSNQWGVYYIWKSLFAGTNPNEAFITLGSASYGTALAADADIPTEHPAFLPDELSGYAVLCGRIIAENGAGADVIQGSTWYKTHFTG